ncbi:MAG: TnsA endonuclease N-terminal domain-containing protein [Methylovirgula sp.]|uniref:TnsA endonuclease N-terminal domain-containing protein n=1 Tax=Methylovirgula sp. TaxID=1978224 RepID=UPI003075F8D4
MTRRLPKQGSIRNVVTGRSDGYTGRVPFARLLTTCAYESLLSGDFLVQTAAFEPDVTGIDSEPFRIHLSTDDGETLWTPDYRIMRASGSREIVEVKPVEDVHPERARIQRGPPDELAHRMREAAARFAAMGRAASELGYRFRLLTEDEIRIEPRLSNAMLILRYAGQRFPSSWLMQARVALATQAVFNVDGLQAYLSPNIDAFPLALHLAWLGELEFDPTRPFSRGSRFVRVGHRLLDPTFASRANS